SADFDGDLLEVILDRGRVDAAPVGKAKPSTRANGALSRVHAVVCLQLNLTAPILSESDIATVDRRLLPVALAARSVILKRAGPQHLSDKMSAGNELLR